MFVEQLLADKGVLTMLQTGALVLVMALMASVASAQGAADRGQKLFTEQKCGLCHSVGATGNKKGPLDDAGKMSAADLKEWIVNAPAMAAKAKSDRKPAMKAYTTLAPADVDALVAYLQTLKK